MQGVGDETRGRMEEMGINDIGGCLDNFFNFILVRTTGI